MIDDEKARQKELLDAEAEKEAQLVAAGAQVREEAMAMRSLVSRTPESGSDGRDQNEENGRKKQGSIRSLEEDEGEDFFELEPKRAQHDEKRLALEEKKFQAEMDKARLNEANARSESLFREQKLELDIDGHKPDNEKIAIAK